MKTSRNANNFFEIYFEFKLFDLFGALKDHFSDFIVRLINDSNISI